MESLFEENTAQKFIGRIKNLKADAKPQWGKMTVGQMVVHTQKPFETAFGEIELKRGMISFLFGGIARKQLTKDKPFGKNLPTDKNFIVKHEPEFETEREKLITLVQKFKMGGPAKLTKKPHPFFGNMTIADWNALMVKHLDHHLRQFGA